MLNSQARDPFHATEAYITLATYLTSFSMIPSSEGTPTRIALLSSGSSWFDFKERNISAVACRLRDHTSLRRGKCMTNNVSFEIMFVGDTSSPISLADCNKQEQVTHLSGYGILILNPGCFKCIFLTLVSFLQKKGSYITRFSTIYAPIHIHRTKVSIHVYIPPDNPCYTCS